MEELYTNDDPDYRDTPVRSGIPPPSSRDQRRHRHDNADLSRYNPALQRQQPRYPNDSRRQGYNHRQEDQGYRSEHTYRQEAPQYASQQQQQQPHYQQQQQQYYQQEQPRPVYQPKLKQPDYRTSTDFLKCEKRLSLKDLASTIAQQPSANKKTDYDFLSSSALVDRVNQLRAKIRDVPREYLSPAKSKSNPFERIGTSIFMNRAATKLAALDATFGLTGTGNSNEEFQFADICGGPGGFSEYLLWRIYSGGGIAHGFGITLKGDDEVNWHTERFNTGIPPHSFTPIRGRDGTGDLYKKENIQYFENAIMTETQREGVQLVVADGGFDFSGKEGQQEIVTQRLILCEIVTMLACLKQGGHFVCKFFDIMSEGTVALVWLLYQLFDEVCINKPLSSRPANSERYIVCKGFIYQHPTEIITKLLSWIQYEDVVGIVPKATLEADEDFIDYLRMRNMKLTMKQTEALEQLDKFLENPDFPSLYDQEQIRRHCLQEWRLPL